MVTGSLCNAIYPRRFDRHVTCCLYTLTRMGSYRIGIILAGSQKGVEEEGCSQLLAIVSLSVVPCDRPKLVMEWASIGTGMVLLTRNL